MLDAGTQAPPFELPDDSGELVRLADLRGRWVLLWWYPKASTPGWTIEGQALRDRAKEFEAADCVVLGASFDTPEDNRAFSQAENFGFALLSDVDRAVGSAYGAAKGKDEQYPDFPKRISYLIDPEGVIRQAYEVSDVAGHAAQVLADLASMQGR